MTIEILGLVFSIVLGTVGHFFYQLSNKNKIIGFFFSKDESFFEHLKLGITPILLWTIVELLTNYSNVLLISKVICVVIFIFCLLILYKGYKFIFKKNILFLDILIFYISLAFAHLYSFNILFNFNSIISNILGIIGFIFILIFYLLFN